MKHCCGMQSIESGTISLEVLTSIIDTISTTEFDAATLMEVANNVANTLNNISGGTFDKEKFLEDCGF